MKKSNKLMSLILAIIMILTIIPTNLMATDESGISKNESYVSAINIKETVDGLAPFDSNNNAGNDTNASNGIVRSFDNVNYTLEYVTALKVTQPITDAYLMVEFTLPCTKDIATFDMDTMAWIVDPQLTEKDGKQILTGKRYLQNTSDNNAIPGTGTLSTG